MPGTFIISLDFELHWGVRDERRIEDYPEIEGAPLAVQALLTLFERRAIEATWAAVGLLMLDGRADAEAASPRRRPGYVDRQRLAYEEFPNLGDDREADPYHFAPHLIRKIVSAPGQELGTHTFSHYYCLEPGETVDDFAADIETALRVAEDRFGVRPRSIVFPRNQVSPTHLEVCKQAGLISYRGVQSGWMHAAAAQQGQGAARRGLRLIDSYLPLSRIQPPSLTAGLVNLPASAFLRPYNPRLVRGDELKLRRITAALEQAAQTGGCFHLWWHPHNFGRNLGPNLEFLCRILDAFESLRDRYGMQSRNMGTAAEEFLAMNRAQPKRTRPIPMAEQRS